jgi:ABC-type branched-subunit amino acid transport system ATPase component
MNAEPSAPLLACRGVSRRFGGLLALDGLDFALDEGRILGLIGPNGSGKTTFFNVLTGLYPATGGTIEFAGRPITRLPPPAVYRSGIARTFQRSRLCLPLSVFDNVVIGDQTRMNHRLWFNVFQRRALRRQLEAAREQARQLLGLFDPPLAGRLDEQVSRIPMIDRRRVEICRALISRPRLLLLDEPSAGMTHEETTRLMDDILEARQRIGQLTIILIEHAMGVIERVTERCIVLNYGRKIAEGTYAEIARDRGVKQAYLGLE